MNRSKEQQSGAGASKNTSQFECAICLEQALEPVVTKCGHLFCWPCMNNWLIQGNSQLVCPVCKAGIARETLIPLYNRGGNSETDPRMKDVPKRPQGERSDPTPNPQANNRNQNMQGGVQFGLLGGLFPMMGFTFGGPGFGMFGGPNPNPQGVNNNQNNNINRDGGIVMLKKLIPFICFVIVINILLHFLDTEYPVPIV